MHLHVTENEDVCGDNLELQLANADLGTTLFRVGNVIGKQKRGSKPTTAVKTLREISLIKTLRRLNSSLYTIAGKHDLADLKTLTGVTRTYMDRMATEDLAGYAEVIITEAGKYPAELSAIGTPSWLVDDLATQVSEFKDWMKAPINAIKNRKAATDSVPGLLKQGKDIIQNRMDGLMLDYEKSNPEFYLGYLAAKEAVHLPVHHKDDAVTDVDATDGK